MATTKRDQTRAMLNERYAPQTPAKSRIDHERGSRTHYDPDVRHERDVAIRDRMCVGRQFERGVLLDERIGRGLLCPPAG